MDAIARTIQGGIDMARLTRKTNYYLKQVAIKYLPKKGIDYFDILNKLGEMEDLEEQGLLLKLPCKVKTPIYFIISTINRETNEWEQHVEEYGFEIYMYDELGKRCFLTKEEAEAKLKETDGE